MNLVSVPFMPISGIMEDVKISTLYFDITREVRSSFPTPTFFFLFFFVKLGVMYFREHKIYILTETGVQVAWSSETTG